MPYGLARRIVQCGADVWGAEGSETIMATLSAGDEVDVALDGIGLRHGIVVAVFPTAVHVKTICTANPCEFGYVHPSGQTAEHISRVSPKKVNPTRLPAPLMTYEELDWGTD